MMKKRFLLTLFMIACGMIVRAEEFKIGDIKYVVLDAENHYVYVCYGDNMPSGELVIEPTVEYNGVTYTVTYIIDNAFYGCGGLTSIDIPNTVTVIGSEAFRNCSNLATITIPSSVTSIGANAFTGCNKIENLSFNTDAIGTIFKNRTSIKTLTIGDSVTTISNSAFSGCSGITSVSIPKSVTSIGEYAFSNLLEIKFESIESLCNIDFGSYYFAQHIFVNNEEITDLIIPESITRIGNYTFCGWSNLTSVTIPNSVTNIGESAFSDVDNLNAVTIECDADLSNAELYFTTDSFRFRVLNQTSVEVVGTSCSENVMIPATITAGNTFVVVGIGDQAFFYCNDLTSVTIPNSVTYIGNSAFCGCTSLTSLNITESSQLTSIGLSAFSGCSGLASVTIPQSVTTIGGLAFSGCSGLLSVTIPQSVTIIDGSAFSDCSSLTSVTIPSSVTSIGNNAFSGCNSIETLSFDTDAIGSLFSGKTSLKTVNIGSSITDPSKFSFSGCTNLETLSFNTNAIGTKFKGWTSIKNINIGDSVTDIPARAFEGCSNLVTINVGKSLSNIGKDAFKNCNKLDYNVYDNAYYVGNDDNPYMILMTAKDKTIKSCEINGNCKVICYNAFERKSGKEIIIPNSVISIGDWAFYACGGLESIVIGDSVSNINEYTFAYCEKLKSITIPNSVKNIGANAFKGCKSLESVVIGDSVIAIGDYSFSNCYSLTSVIIGKSVKYIGEKAFDYCSHIDPIICLSVKPAEIAGDPFPSRDTVYVPAECIETYKTATYWKRKVILPFGIVSFKSDNNTYGTVYGDSILLDNNSITITALPKDGYHFTSWSDGNKDNPRIFTEAKNVSITALFEEHKIVIDSAVAATCTNYGLTEGSHCSVCGVVLVTQNETPMAEHTSVVDVAVAATATETGLTEGSHCSVCGAVIVAQEVIPALGEQGGDTPEPGTAVTESVADNLLIYAHGRTIVVENATDEIRVYDAMGRLICRDAMHCVSTEIRVNTAGVYLVKVGNVAKRVVVN